MTSEILTRVQHVIVAHETGAPLSFPVDGRLAVDMAKALVELKADYDAVAKTAGAVEILAELLKSLKADCEKLAAECANLKEVIYPIANEHTDCECTDRPVWYVVNPRQMMRPTASAVCRMFHGPFWSRERAEEFMSSTRYRYGDKASVFCTSLYHYPEMRRLFDASKNLETPATDSAIAELKAQGVDEFAEAVADRHSKTETGSRLEVQLTFTGDAAVSFATKLRAGVNHD